MLIYTFRTFPRLEQLPDKTFVFPKLKEDLETLKQRLVDEQPEYIVGIAASTGLSRIEPTTVNQFNKGKISKEGPDSFNLFVPEASPFKPASRPTHSFCNWTMYKLQEFITNSGLKT